jgi:hypothetical protein
LVFLGHTGNDELIPKSHVALLVSHAAFTTLTSKFFPNAVKTLLNFTDLLHSQRAAHFPAKLLLPEGRASTA